MGETALGLAVGISGGAAALGGLVALLGYQWGVAVERGRWFKLVADQQKAAAEVLSQPAPTGADLLERL